MANKVPFSTHGLAPSAIVDVDAQSNRAKARVVIIPIVMATASGQDETAIFTQNSTVKHALGAVGVPSILVDAYISYDQLPAGGTLSAGLVAYDASANGEVVLTTPSDPEAATVREGQQQVIAATNVALAADDTIELHCVADNNAVGTAAEGVRVTLVFQPVEEDVPTA